jgi:hypothetical protein
MRLRGLTGCPHCPCPVPIRCRPVSATSSPRPRSASCAPLHALRPLPRLRSVKSRDRHSTVVRPDLPLRCPPSPSTAPPDPAKRIEVSPQAATPQSCATETVMSVLAQTRCLRIYLIMCGKGTNVPCRFRETQSPGRRRANIPLNHPVTVRVFPSPRSPVSPAQVAIFAALSSFEFHPAVAHRPPSVQQKRRGRRTPVNRHSSDPRRSSRLPRTVHAPKCHAT